MNTNEIWFPVLGSARYEVSNFGNVRNAHTKETKAQRKTPKGYKVVTLKEGGVRKCRYIHRLVAEAFLQNPSGLPQVNHKDENKENNMDENLEWCSAKYNINYGTAPTRRSEALKGRTPSNCQQVLQIDKHGKEAGRFASATEAGEKLGICSEHIGEAANGKRQTAGGYRWEWI